MHTLTYDQVIEHVGYGRFQRKPMIVYGLGWAADAQADLQDLKRSA